MGIDAMIYVRNVTDEQIEAARKYLAARDPSWRIRRSECADWAMLDTSEYAGWAMLDTAWRYYGPGYERGPWPEIYGGIRGMMGAFPRLRPGVACLSGFELTRRRRTAACRVDARVLDRQSVNG